MNKFYPNEPSIVQTIITALVLIGCAIILAGALYWVISQPTGYDYARAAIVNSIVITNDNNSSDLSLIYKGDVHDGSMPYLYVFEWHNSTGWHYASLWIPQDLSTWDKNTTIDYSCVDDPGFKWIMDKYG